MYREFLNIFLLFNIEKDLSQLIAKRFKKIYFKSP